MRRIRFWEIAPGLVLVSSCVRADTPATPAIPPSSASPPKAAGKAAESEAQKMQRARQKLDAFLEALQAKSGDVTPIRDEALVRVFPRVSFFAVRYQLHPVPIAPPAPLRFANVIAVPESAGQFRILTETNKILSFFTGAVPPQKTPEGRKDAASAWLRLAEELAEDGPYGFAPPAVQVVAGSDGKEISAQSMVTSGGTGKVEVTLYFDAAGHIMSVSSSCKVTKGTP